LPKSSDEWVFGRGALAGSQRAFFSSFPMTDSEEPEDATQVVVWSPEKVGVFFLPWQAKSICYLEHPERHGIVMGAYGEVRVSTARRQTDEIIDSTNSGPTRLGVLRDLRVIGRHVYAVGMSRQCYRRESGTDSASNGVWQRIDAGIVEFGPPDPVVGFNSVDGFSETDIYAVGWRGEIWNYDGRRWSAVSSPTNLKLERVVCAPDGAVYAVGQAGLIIRGAQNQWEIIEQKVTTDQFWGATWFRNRLWLSTSKDIYALNADKSVENVSLGLAEPTTCGWLMSADDIIWSVGSQHLVWSKDGDNWMQVIFEPPANR